ncbi:MAG: OmpA family protein [Saprospiraceae bacterium]|nr:OmpA family protein [Saprospiraceae bacterium]
MYRIFLLLLWSSTAVFSQNYVLNGGFEREPAPDTRLRRYEATPCMYSSCPEIVNDYAQGWKTYYCMTPDLLIVPDTAACSTLPPPRRGKRMLGLIMYLPFQDGKNDTDYHELVQGTLAKPLDVGKTYRVWCWVRTDDSLGARHLYGVYGRSGKVRPVRCGNFGFFFSKDPINPKENFMQSQSSFPIRPQLNWEEVVDPPPGEWRKISFLFTADQAYKYFLFGNFFFDAVTPINLSVDERGSIEAHNLNTPDWPQKTARIGYYCFDDFVVEEFKGNELTRTLLEKKSLQLEAAVLFDVGQAVLKPGARPVLDSLAAALQALPELCVEIGGHTDNTGADAANQALSEHRARAVCQYLQEKGIAERQIRWRGYGETQPIAGNDTDAGRQKNRRVECRVVQ